MRTTLTLDKDVVALLDQVRKQQKTTLKEIINQALREGLNRMMSPQKTRARYRTRSVALGRCFLGSVDDVAEALAVAEGEAFE